MAAAPAQAAVGTICVGAVPAGTVCNDNRATIQAAIAVATAGDTIRPAPGAAHTDGPYVLPTGVSLRGFGAGTGAGATKLSLPAGAQTYVTVTGPATVADVRVEMTTGNGATGIAATNATVDNVVVFGPGATNSNGLQAQGSQVHDATVNVTGGSGNTGIRSLGGNLLYADSTWNGGAVGFRLVSGTDFVSRVTVNLAQTAVSVEGGTLNIDDAVIDLGATGQTGVEARPTGGATTATVNANHLTVVGGAGGSRGVAADANGAGTLEANVTLTNSIVWGPTTSLVRLAGGGHTANFTVTRSDYQTTSATAPTDGGGNVINVDPAFIDTAGGDYHLRGTSPVVDKAAGSPASLDRDSKGRSFDGDEDGTPVPDMGAYELRDVTAPTTTFVEGPSGPTKDKTPVFRFRSQAGATFECQIDTGAWQKCASPVTTTPLSEGAHRFSVRATDAALNTEAVPPVRNFTVDTKSPNVSITKRPPKRFFKQRVKFKFAANEAGVTFQCKLDKRPWQKCTSPFRLNVQRGWHTFQVRATDAAKNVDPKPATYRFKRIVRHR